MLVLRIFGVIMLARFRQGQRIVVLQDAKRRHAEICGRAGTIISVMPPYLISDPVQSYIVQIDGDVMHRLLEESSLDDWSPAGP